MKDFITSKGGDASSRVPKRAERERSKGRLAVVVLTAAIAIAIAGGAWWWFASRTESAPRTEETPKRVPPKTAPRHEPQTADRETRPTAGHEARNVKQELQTAGGLKEAVGRKRAETQTTNLDAQTIYDRIASRYTTNSAVRPLNPNDPDLPVKTGVYQEIGSLMSGELGDPVAPFPYSFQVDDANDQNDQFLASLKHKVELKDDDTVTAAERKRKTLQARLDLLDAIDAGLTVKDALKEAYMQRVRAYEARQAYVADLKAYADENPAASDFNKVLEDVNAKLGERGIKKIRPEDLGLEEPQD